MAVEEEATAVVVAITVVAEEEVASMAGSTIIMAAIFLLAADSYLVVECNDKEKRLPRPTAGFKCLIPLMGLPSMGCFQLQM